MIMGPSSSPLPPPRITAQRIVFVGMMGSGKTSVGHRLAKRLGMPYFDSDVVLERAHSMTVSDYFAKYGEDGFRAEEKRTVTVLLQNSSCVLSLGGGAFVNPETRALIKDRAITIWLKANVDMLLERALRHGTRPLLNVPDPRAKMLELMTARENIYAEADVVVESDNRPLDVTAERVQQALEEFITARAPKSVEEEKI